jgi:hypothetical protein
MAGVDSSAAQPRTAYDVRDLARTDVDRRSSAARTALARRLGERGFVNTAARSGGVAFLGRSDGFLTGPSRRDPAVVALAYVADHPTAFGLDLRDLGALRLRDRYRSLDGVTHLTWSQQTQGVESHDTFLVANVTARGQLVNVGGAPVGDLHLETIDPVLSAGEALASAGAQTLAGGERLARLVAFAGARGSRLAWRVEVDPGSQAEQVLVDAVDGRVLARTPLSSSANSALVYRLHPDQQATPTMVDLGADPTWIDRSEGGTKLQGNNAHAQSYLQFTGDPTEVAQVGGNWSFPATFFNHAPECPAFGCTWDSDDQFATRHSNREQTTTQGFYYLNHFHDHLLKAPIGFDEASRNFEFANATGQGAAGDPIELVTLRGVQAILGRFEFRADGIAPKLETWFSPGPYDVNAGDSAEVMYHEYTHGLAFRLIGSGTAVPTPAQAGALAEGWADWYAEDLVVEEGLVADGPASGEVPFAGYLGGAPGRTEALDCAIGAGAAACPGGGSAGSGGYTYGDLGKILDADPGEVHANGEIWAQTLWDLRARVGVQTARCIVTGGLRLSPDNPDFLEARDAILQSALVVGVAHTPVWEVFAARGMGADATSPGTASVDVTEDFTVPTGLPEPPAPTGDCGSDAPPPGAPGGEPPGPGQGAESDPPGGSGTEPTLAQIASGLGADLTEAARRLGRVKLAKLVQRGGFTATGLDALSAGRYVLALRAGRLTVATGSRAVPRAGRYSVRLRLTKQGTRLLRRARRVRARLTLGFVPPFGTAQTRSTKVTLRR